MIARPWLVRVAVLAGLALAATEPSARQDQQRPVFRASAHAVVVDVAVFDGDRVVTGLDRVDFAVLDNGVAQAVVGVEANRLPLDLRLVFDTSGSISERDLAHYLRAMREVAAALGPDDRGEIVTFNSRIADAASRQHPPLSINPQRGGPDGTSFFDAVSLALITVPSFDRRQITIVLSDARDNASFFDEATILDVARRTDAVVYTIAPPGPGQNPAVPMARLQALSTLTGGRLIQAAHDRLLGQTVTHALDEFRHGYVLRYTPSGVAREGWHTLTVTVRGRERYTVRARAGYYG